VLLLDLARLNKTNACRDVASTLERRPANEWLRLLAPHRYRATKSAQGFLRLCRPSLARESSVGCDAPLQAGLQLGQFRHFLIFRLVYEFVDTSL